MMHKYMHIKMLPALDHGRHGVLPTSRPGRGHTEQCGSDAVSAEGGPELYDKNCEDITLLSF